MVYLYMVSIPTIQADGRAYADYRLLYAIFTNFPAWRNEKLKDEKYEFATEVLDKNDDLLISIDEVQLFIKEVNPLHITPHKGRDYIPQFVCQIHFAEVLPLIDGRNEHIIKELREITQSFEKKEKAGKINLNEEPDYWDSRVQFNEELRKRVNPLRDKEGFYDKDGRFYISCDFIQKWLDENPSVQENRLKGHLDYLRKINTPKSGS